MEFIIDYVWDVGFQWYQVRQDGTEFLSWSRFFRWLSTYSRSSDEDSFSVYQSRHTKDIRHDFPISPLGFGGFVMFGAYPPLLFSYPLCFLLSMLFLHFFSLDFFKIFVY